MRSDESPMTLEKIGARLGITRERVRQLREKGLAHLRNGAESAVLSAFLR
jgi:RNA polymerase primary sigma factor